MELAETPGRRSVSVQILSVLLCYFLAALNITAVMKGLDYKRIKNNVIIPVSWMSKSLGRIRVFTRKPAPTGFCTDASMVAFICYKMNYSA